MVFRSYNKRLREQIACRDAALSRMRCETDLIYSSAYATLAETKVDLFNKIDGARDTMTNTFNQTRLAITDTFAAKYEDIKTTINPETHIRRHPWIWMFGAVVAGVVAVPFLKSYFSNTDTKRESNSNEPVKTKETTSAWMPIIEAMLPMLIEYTKTMLHQNGGNGPISNNFSVAESPPPQSVSGLNGDSGVGSAKHSRTMSRHTAPPPPPGLFNSPKVS